MRSFRKELRAISRAPQDAGEADASIGGIDADLDAGQDSTSQVDDSGKSNNNMVSLAKQDFRDFTIIGQYNLGFILAKCRKNHLWVLDQYVSLCKTLRHAVSYSHTILPFL
jgi:DNA mismatch repair ATPase MutL